MKFQPSQYSSRALVRTNTGEMGDGLNVGNTALVGGGLLVFGGLLLAPTFIVFPWVIKQFKPEWSYGKRVAASIGAGFAIGAVSSVARAASGK